MDGWLKLHRSIIDSALFKDLEVLKIWIWLLCNASFDTHDTLFFGKVITVHPGQIVTGRKKIAQSTDLNESKVYRALMLLKSLGNIEIKSNNKFSVITIVKWAKYQGDLEIVNSKTTAKQQQDNNTATTGQQQDNTTKEIKKLKKERNNKICPFFESVWSIYPNKQGKSAVSKKAMKELADAGEEVITAAVEKYRKKIEREKTDIKYVIHGSTFFNGRWTEFVEDEQAEEPQTPKRRKSF